MYIYPHLYIYTYIHRHIYTDIHKYMNTDLHIYMCAYTHIDIYTHIYICFFFFLKRLRVKTYQKVSESHAYQNQCGNIIEMSGNV